MYSSSSEFSKLNIKVFVPTSNFVTLQEPLEAENAWEIDTPHDNSCLFWAATLAYLMPVITDEFSFRNRFIKLFGESSVDKLNLIGNLFKSYNPFTNVDPLKNLELNQLVREQFRSRVIDYIFRNSKKYKQYWENQDNPHERTFEDYLSRMYDPDSWGGELEIKAINELLDCDSQVIANGYTMDYKTDNIDAIVLVHVNAAFNEAQAGNHYRFRIDKALGDAYKDANKEDNDLEHLKKRAVNLPGDTALNYLFKEYQCETRREVLFKSTEAGNLQDLKTILEIGVDVNAVKENTLQTALHIALLKNFQAIAVLLLREGANSNVPDLNQKTAEIYAAELGIELYELKKIALSDAFALRDFFRVSDLMAQLASFQLDRNEHIAAALLLNGALAAIEKKPENFRDKPGFKDKLIAQLKSIEPALIKQLLKDPNYEYRPANDICYGINPEHKEFLDIMRLNVKALFEEIKPITVLPDEQTSDQIQELYQFITNQISELLEKILQDCIQLLPGQPPCGYALIGTGSLARGEITPYSDIECFLLIEEDTPENIQYFSNLSILLQLKIINFGETDLTKGYNLLPVTVQNPTSKGFSLDVHKNPTNKKQSLIGTPQQIARYQLREHYVQEAGNHFSGAFINLRYITGNNRELLPGLQRAMRNIYGQSSGVNSLRLTRTLAMLKEDVAHFEPKADQMSEGHLLDAKEDFYRLLQTFMDSLSLYKDLTTEGTWERVKELEKQGFFNQTGCLHLLQLHNVAIWFRLKTYLHYGYQAENIDVFFSVSSNELSLAAPIFAIQKADLNLLTQMYKVLMPLHECMVVFHNSNGTQNLFPSNKFYDESLMTAGNIASRLCQYPEAERFFEAALQLALEQETPRRVFIASKQLAHVAKILGNFRKASHYLEITLEAFREVLGLIPIERARILIALSNTTSAPLGLSYATEALKIVTDILGPKDLEVAITKNNLSKILLTLGKYEEAIREIQEAIDIQVALKGRDYPGLFNSYNSLGFAYQELNQYANAFDTFNEALRIVYLHYGLKHPNAVTIFVNLSSLHRSKGNYSTSLKFINLALSSRIALLGENHPEVANLYHNLGGLWIERGDLVLAEECYKKVSNIYSIHAMIDPLSLANDHCNWGHLYYQKGDNENAEKHFHLALEYISKSHETSHYKKKDILNQLAMILFHQKKYDQSLKLFEEALLIVKSHFGENNFNAVTMIHNQGLVYRELKRFDEAYACFNKALNIVNATFKFSHPVKEVILTSYAKTLDLAGLIFPAVDMYKKALDVACDIYGRNSSDFITKLLSFDLRALFSLYYHIGLDYFELNKLDLAKSFFEKALDMSYRMYGSKHPMTALVFFNLGLVSEEKNPEIAQKAFSNALDIIMPFKEKHPILIHIVGNLKVIATGQDTYYIELEKKPVVKESTAELQTSLNSSINKLSRKLTAIACNYHNLQNYDNAIYCHQQSLEVHSQLVGREDMETALSYCEIAEVWKDIGNPQKVKEYFIKALNIAINILEPSDPLIIRMAKNLDSETLSKMGIQIVPVPTIFPEEYSLCDNDTRPLIFSAPQNREPFQARDNEKKVGAPNKAQVNK